MSEPQKKPEPRAFIRLPRKPSALARYCGSCRPPSPLKDVRPPAIPASLRREVAPLHPRPKLRRGASAHRCSSGEAQYGGDRSLVRAGLKLGRVVLTPVMEATWNARALGTIRKGPVLDTSQRLGALIENGRE